MKKSLILLLVILSLNLLWADKIIMQKSGAPRKNKLRLKHPAQEIFDSRILPEDNRKIGSEENKLIVILVQFQEEVIDNTATTGNGHFLTYIDSLNGPTIGMPPHDQEYYSSVLESVRNYYRAASYGHFELDYDIWPKDKPAYTLSHEMSYYSPSDVGSSLFVERLEEYFKESWETADRDDPEIDFSQYQHFMLVHAGADWQHDTFGDTPSDMPSLFIRIGTGKEAIVDDGQVLIRKSCNVPETISQDYEEYEYVDDNGVPGVMVYGHGSPNAVFAHEFGHSMGLVDLYDTHSSTPMVGYFDIMDSGGSGIMQSVGRDNKLYNYEGALPALPGAYSKSLMFEDIFRDEGIIKDINELSFEESMEFSAAESMVKPINKLRIIKVPLSDSQYLLLEHRSVDPDGDGGTAVKSTLSRRVILGPTTIGGGIDSPLTFEYDYLLPSWQKWNSQNGSYDSYGGGVLAWRINEDILNKVLYVDNEGNPITNFDNNSVNTNLYRRGIELVEADNIKDIGEPSSFYWSGTPYEYFFPQKPMLDSEGLFVSWSLETHTPVFSGSTKPALADSYGHPSQYSIEFLSNPTGVMEMKLSFLNSTYTQEIYTNDDLVGIGPIFQSEFGMELPIVTEHGIMLYTQLDNQGEWHNYYDIINEYVDKIDYYPVVINDERGNGCLVLVSDNNILTLTPLKYGEISGLPEITAAPIVFYNYDIQGNYLRLLGIPTTEGFYVYQYVSDCDFSFREIVEGKVIEAGYLSNNNDVQTVLIMFENDVREYNIQNEYIDGGSPIFCRNPGYNFNGYSSLRGMFVTNNSKLLSIEAKYDFTYYATFAFKEQIDFSKYSSIPPTNLAYGRIGNIENVFVWGAGDHLFAMKNNALLEGFPVKYDGLLFKSRSYPRLVDGIIQIQTDGNGYYSINSDGEILSDESYTNYSENNDNELCYSNGYLYNAFISNSHSVFVNQVKEYEENPIEFSGYRSLFNVTEDFSNTEVTGFNAYIYPNPIRSIDARFRVYNPASDYELIVYDIAGNKVYTDKITLSRLDLDKQYFEASLRLDKLSAGAYFCVYKDRNKTKKIKFSIEK